MKVKELREVLSKYDDDVEVGISYDAGYGACLIDEDVIVLEKKEDWVEEFWGKHFGDVNKVLVFDLDEGDDDDEEDDEPRRWSNCRN